ncbi:DUF2884 family protein [Enterobacteriaceae bacterium ESL0689]|nr:DUF2884 family protein [Enterobacteriaceae bacterium ESL0689]
MVSKYCRGLLALSLFLTLLPAWARYPCPVMLRDDIILTPQHVQVKGEHGDLLIMPDGNLSWNGKQYPLTATQHALAQNYQSELRHNLRWVDDGIHSRVEKGRQMLSEIIAQQAGNSSTMQDRLSRLDSQLKMQINRVIEHRHEGLAFHYQAIDKIRADGQQLINQAMGGLLQDSINDAGIKAAGTGEGNGLKSMLSRFAHLQTAIQNGWHQQQADVRQFGQDVCQRIARLEKRREALVNSLK